MPDPIAPSLRALNVIVAVTMLDGHTGSLWTKWAKDDGAMVFSGQVFVPGVRPTRADVVNAFEGGL